MPNRNPILVGVVLGLSALVVVVTGAMFVRACHAPAVAAASIVPARPQLPRFEGPADVPAAKPRRSVRVITPRPAPVQRPEFRGTIYPPMENSASRPPETTKPVEVSEVAVPLTSPPVGDAPIVVLPPDLSDAARAAEPRAPGKVRRFFGALGRSFKPSGPEGN